MDGTFGRLRRGGARSDVSGIQPARSRLGCRTEVFGNVSNDLTIAREEIFGPVLSVIPARDEADAMRIANETNYGLNASVFTHDSERAYAAARAIRAGTVGHNASRVDLSIGFGGFKQSGVGREGGGVDGLSAFLERKTVLLEAYPTHLGG